MTLGKGAVRSVSAKDSFGLHSEPGMDFDSPKHFFHDIPRDPRDPITLLLESLGAPSIPFLGLSHPFWNP